MELSLLRTCLAIYRTGSLTRAARELGISQPAVTGHLRTLEKALSEPLFERTPHGTVPTEAAHQLVRETREPLDSLESVLQRRLDPSGLADRTVRLAGPPEIISSRVLPAVTDLILDGLRLTVGLGATEDLLAGLVDGFYDLVITTSQPRSPALRVTPLTDEEFVLVGCPEWARRRCWSGAGADELADVSVIAYSEHLPIIRQYWMSAFGIRPTFDVAVTVPDLRAVLAAVCSGAGVSVLPTYLCSEQIERGELCVLHELEVAPLNTLFLAARAGGRTSVGLTTLRSHLLMKPACGGDGRRDAENGCGEHHRRCRVLASHEGAVDDDVRMERVTKDHRGACLAQGMGKVGRRVGQFHLAVFRQRARCHPAAVEDGDAVTVVDPDQTGGSVSSGGQHRATLGGSLGETRQALAVRKFLECTDATGEVDQREVCGFFEIGCGGAGETLPGNGIVEERPLGWIGAIDTPQHSSADAGADELDIPAVSSQRSPRVGNIGKPASGSTPVDGPLDRSYDDASPERDRRLVDVLRSGFDRSHP